MLANVFEGKWPVVVTLHQPLFGREKEFHAGAAASTKMMLKAVDRVIQKRTQKFLFWFVVDLAVAKVEIGERRQSVVAKQRQ